MLASERWTRWLSGLNCTPVSKTQRGTSLAKVIRALGTAALSSAIASCARRRE